MPLRIWITSAINAPTPLLIPSAASGLLDPQLQTGVERDDLHFSPVCGMTRVCYQINISPRWKTREQPFMFRRRETGRRQRASPGTCSRVAQVGVPASSLNSSFKTAVSSISRGAYRSDDCSFHTYVTDAHYVSTQNRDSSWHGEDGPPADAPQTFSFTQIKSSSLLGQDRLFYLLAHRVERLPEVLKVRHLATPATESAFGASGMMLGRTSLKTWALGRVHHAPAWK